MFASPHQGRWLALACGLIALFYLVTRSRPTNDPLIGELKGVSTSLDELVSDEVRAEPDSVPLFAPTSRQIPGYDGPFINTNDGNPRAQRSKIAKMTMLYYDTSTETTETYERAMKSHIPHDEKFGYDHYVLRRALMEGFWTKQAEMLHLLITELAKPPEDRYEWLFWHDADLVLVNPNVPLEIFLPPPDDWEHIHFLVTNDLSGFNSGTYFCRVHEWSVQFMAASIAFPKYRPHQGLVHDDQTAQDFLLAEPQWADHTLHVPQRWFNAYHNFGRNRDIPPEWDWTHGYAEPGDLLVHFPGTGDQRSDRMEEWLQKIEDASETYCPPLSETEYVANVTRFWEEDAPREKEIQDTFWRHYRLLQTVGPEQDRLREAAVEDVRQAFGSMEEGEVDEEIEKIKEEWNEKKIAALREAEEKGLAKGTIYEHIP